jgi:6-pyruvoyltetrahydropterin/6-carboxytetrahydropterin synthase
VCALTPRLADDGAEPADTFIDVRRQGEGGDVEDQVARHWTKDRGDRRSRHAASSSRAAGFLPSPWAPNRIHAMFVRLTKTFHFEAAHDLPTFPEGHKCRRLHGHSFRFDVVVEGDVDPARGYLIDYGDIKKAVEPVIRRLDHYYLNEIDGLSNPTSENLAKWLWDRIKCALPGISTITVYETCTSACEYRGES